jgi:nucleotide-binding universal stress UspA family protein
MKIVVGVDGGEQQPHALELARVLARVEGGSVVIARVLLWSRWSMRLGGPHMGTASGEDDDVLRAAAGQLRDTATGLALVTDLSVPRGLHRVAEETEADVIVIGSSHRGPVGRTLLGGSGTGVLHAPPCAIAVAPGDYAPPAEGVRRIGIAYDAEPESRAALAWARRTAERLGAEVTVISAVETVYDAEYPGAAAYTLPDLLESIREGRRRELQAAVAELPEELRPTGMLVDGAPARAIAGAATDLDLLIAGSRGYGPLGAVLLGSVSRGLMHHSPCPLVLLPRSAEEDHADAGADARAATS